MSKQRQSNHEYHCFLNNAKASFDSSEKVRLHSELFVPAQKLRLLDTDLYKRNKLLPGTSKAKW